ncbi:MAG: DUF6671 family protein [Snowella sp.]|nr:DUF6671 family protein [Snowella sp.]
MTDSPWFQNRTIVIATKHQKEQVIAPLLTEAFNLNVIVPPDFDTDQFGTFTRDIKRRGTQIEAARFKAEAILEQTGESLAIASEGSFAPHPAFPFISANREIVLLLDKKHDLVIYGEELSTETNHYHQTVKTIEEALVFAEKIGFPEHGLVAMFDPDTQHPEQIFKGIQSQEEFIKTVQFVLQESLTKTAHLETDMRAMCNPTRMKVIEKATQNLIQKLRQYCPQCNIPGFDVTEKRSGLPCSWCNAPTSLILAEVYQCHRCHFQQEQRFPTGIKAADPTYCSYCNP